MKLLIAILLIAQVCSAQDSTYQEIQNPKYKAQRMVFVQSLRHIRDSALKAEPKWNDSILTHPGMSAADTNGTYYGYFLGKKREQIQELIQLTCPIRREMDSLNHSFYRSKRITIVGDRHCQCFAWEDPN